MKKEEIKKFMGMEKRRVREIQEREEYQAKCDHKIEKNGKIISKLKSTSGGKQVCSICGSKIDFDPISRKEIAVAAETFEKALQQFKTVIDDVPEKVLNDIAFAIQVSKRLESIYEPIREELTSVGEGTGFIDDEDSTGNYFSGNYPLIEMDNKKKHHNKNKGHHNNKNKKKGKGKNHNSGWLY